MAAALGFRNNLTSYNYAYLFRIVTVIPVIVLTSINQLVFIMDTDCVICEAGTEVWCKFR